MKKKQKQKIYKLSKTITRSDLQEILEAKELQGELNKKEVRNILDYCDKKRSLN